MICSNGWTRMDETQHLPVHCLWFIFRYWINQGASNSEFWAHEFSKHATCFSTFEVSVVHSNRKDAANNLLGTLLWSKLHRAWGRDRLLRDCHRVLSDVPYMGLACSGTYRTEQHDPVHFVKHSRHVDWGVRRPSIHWLQRTPVQRDGCWSGIGR